jgi:hypothetical protein
MYATYSREYQPPSGSKQFFDTSLTIEENPVHSKQRKIPIKIILNDDAEVVSQENNSYTTEENSIHNYYPNLSPPCEKCMYPNLILVFKIEAQRDGFPVRQKKVVYIFNILKSRKKEKKYLRKKFNKIITRVHNMDCLLKKIKAYVLI